MVKTYLYIPEDLNKEINQLALAKKASKASVLRAVIRKGVEAEKEIKSGAEVLLELAAYAKKHHIHGPRDLSINHDYYLWGGKKKSAA